MNKILKLTFVLCVMIAPMGFSNEEAVLAQKIIRLVNPGDSVFNGIQLAKQGKLNQAISEFTHAIELNPKNATAYFNRGLAYRLKGNFEQAISDYTKALELNPKYSNIYNVRAIAYYKNKDFDKSWEDVRQYEAMGGQLDPAFLNHLKAESNHQK